LTERIPMRYSRGASILLAASVFHFRILSIGQVKEYLRGKGLPVAGR